MTPRFNPFPGAQKRFFDEVSEMIELGVATHAAMCANATLTPDQALSIARHTLMELDDQKVVYAGGGLNKTEVIIVGDLMQHDRRLIALEPRMFKMEPRMLRDVEPPAVVPRKGKKRDWEQRNRKQQRR